MSDPTTIPSCSACSEPIPDPTEHWPAATAGTVCQTCWEVQSSRLWWDLVRLLPGAPGRPIFRKGGAVVAFVGGDLKPYRRPGTQQKTPARRGGRGQAPHAPRPG